MKQKLMSFFLENNVEELKKLNTSQGYFLASLCEKVSKERELDLKLAFEKGKKCAAEMLVNLYKDQFYMLKTKENFDKVVNWCEKWGNEKANLVLGWFFIKEGNDFSEESEKKGLEYLSKCGFLNEIESKKKNEEFEELKEKIFEWK
jgi:hypothetical protein